MSVIQKFCEGDSNYTPEQVKEFIGSCRSFANMAVMTYAHALLTHRGLHDLAALIHPNITDHAGQVVLSFAETDNKLRLTLDIGPSSYKEIPLLFNDAYLEDLQDKYHFCVTATITFWKSFVAMTRYQLPSDMQELKQDMTNPISLYFDPTYEKRLIVYGCYIDSNGRMLVKK